MVVKGGEALILLKDIWPGLETFLVATSGGIQWVEAKDTAKHPTTPRTVGPKQ